LVLCAWLLLPPSLTAQDVLSCAGGGLEWGFGPTIVPAEDFAKHFGASAHAGLCAQGHVAQRAGLWSYVLAAGGRYLWVDRTVEIPDATEARAAALLSWSLPGGDIDLNPGFLEFGGSAAYEASPNRLEQHVAAGGEIRYGNNSAATIGMFIPSLVARWEWVEPTASEARDTTAAVGEDGDGHSRWSVRAYLNIRARYFSTTLESWSLLIDGSIFRANGLEQVLAEAGWDSGEYIAVTLRFARTVELLGPLTLTSIFAEYAAGQLPTDFEGRDAFSGGVSLSIGR
jgi:hypothetical protein